MYGRWCCVVDDCSGGVMLTVRGDNLDVVHKSRMVVTVTIRQDDDDDTGSDETPDRKDAEQLKKTYESVVCVSCISDMELVIRSPGQWVIWLIFHVRVTGSPGHHFDPV